MKYLRLLMLFIVSALIGYSWGLLLVTAHKVLDLISLIETVLITTVFLQ